MKAGGDGLGKDVEPRLCLCGCGQEVFGYLRRGRYFPAAFVRGHNAKFTDKTAAVQAISTFHDEDCVDPAQVWPLLCVRMLQDLLGMGKNEARLMVKRPRIRRATALRILQALAEMPRNPSVAEKRLTARRLDLRRKEREAIQKQSERLARAN